MGLRHLAGAGLLVLAAPLHAQGRQLTAADSALVLAILSAEDRRDSLAPALVEGAMHGDARIRVLAGRAKGRSLDPAFAGRTALPPVPPAPVWSDPEWKARYRALPPRNAPCGPAIAALDDPAWPVRLRALDVLHAGCGGDAALLDRLEAMTGSVPPAGAPRAAGQVTWHGSAHALVALARLDAARATPHVRRLAGSDNVHVRRYAAVAARVVQDTFLLHTMAADADPNVREAAVTGLGVVAGRSQDLALMVALADTAPQVVRAAAEALAGSTDPALRETAESALPRWVARGSDSERDARVALLALLGREPGDDPTPRHASAVPAAAAALALGAERRLRVEMDPASGGGSFVVRLRGDVAPITAARILALADSGYYDGTTWHRVEHDFVVQGGSHGDNEYVGYPAYFRDELGSVPHPRGTVGMSTRGHDTGDAQWFINLRDNPRLMGDYTVFAEVVDGMEVVDGVMEGDRIARVSTER